LGRARGEGGRKEKGGEEERREREGKRRVEEMKGRGKGCPPAPKRQAWIRQWSRPYLHIVFETGISPWKRI